MREEDNGPTRYVIDRMFQMLRQVDHMVPKAWRLRFEAELRGLKAGFIDRNGIHPVIPKGRGIMDDIVEHFGKEHKDRRVILNMVNAAIRENTLPGFAIDLQHLRLNLLKEEYVLTVYDHKIIAKVINAQN